MEIAQNYELISGHFSKVIQYNGKSCFRLYQVRIPLTLISYMNLGKLYHPTDVLIFQLQSKENNNQLKG